MSLISIKNLNVGYPSRKGQFINILKDVNLKIHRGESIGLVGESGSGKSTLALAALGYFKRGLKISSGSVKFDAVDMLTISDNELQSIRGGRIALIPQNSGQSLTPTKRIGEQIREALKLHSDLASVKFDDRVYELLAKVRLPDPKNLINRYPHELSGGQQQRVAIAMALGGEPEALLLDEPTTGLDVTTQAHILELLREISNEEDMAMLYVSHDLGAIARVCDRVAVMYSGEIVLTGTSRQVLKKPKHPYAHGLLSSIPKLSLPSLPVAMEGRPPMPGEKINGCAFAERCKLADEKCFSVPPQLLEIDTDEYVRCFNHSTISEIPTQQKIEHRSSKSVKINTLLLEKTSISYAKSNILSKIFGNNEPSIHTVDGIDITVNKGETLGLVGESGSGKSTILKAIAGLISPVGGKIQLNEYGYLEPRVDQRSKSTLRQIQLVFQNPDDSLNPRHTVANILEQPLRLYFGLSGRNLVQKSVSLLEKVRLSSSYLDRLPSQLSGGEKQRVAIARAFAAEPQLVLCDEVTSALDVSVQAAVLDLLEGLKSERGITYIFVSHDLAVVRAISDRVAVLYQGRLCEIGTTQSVYEAPFHPYTDVLLGAVLEPDPDIAPSLSADDIVELSPPALGCPFQRRCPRKIGKICENEKPPMQNIKPGHFIACHINPEHL